MKGGHWFGLSYVECVKGNDLHKLGLRKNACCEKYDHCLHAYYGLLFGHN